MPGLDAPADTALQTGQTLIAMPHQEIGGNQQYEFLISGGSADGPYTDAEGQPIVDAAFVRPGGPPPEGDSTPPVCGRVHIEKKEAGELSEVWTTATDAESGIASVTFTTLFNLEGYVEGAGPYEAGDVHTTPTPHPETVEIRGKRIDFGKGRALLTKVTNAAGLSTPCAPATEPLASVPERFGLSGNYPNSFACQTMITLHVPKAASVRGGVRPAGPEGRHAGGRGAGGGAASGGVGRRRGQ